MQAEPFDNLFKPAPMIDCEEWLKDLDYAASDDSRPTERPLLRQRSDAVKAIINELLPRPFQLDRVNSKGVSFVGPGQANLTLSQLSDGYRTMFGLAVDLLRRVVERSKPGSTMFEQHPDNRWYVTMPGVVLLDEIEAHLHPRWQREVGHYLQRSFPNIQFIVATHSPFVVQAATEGGILVFSRKRRGEIVVDSSIESLRGWRAEQILYSPAFGLESTRDPETDRLIREHGHLQSRVEAGLPLDLAQKQRLDELSRLLVGRLPDVMPSDMVSLPLARSGGRRHDD